MTQDYVAWESNDTFNPALPCMTARLSCCIGQKINPVSVSVTVPHVSDTPLRATAFTSSGKRPRYFIRITILKRNWNGRADAKTPRIAVTAEGLYVMTYTQWNRHIPRLAIATSRNLKDWTKHGPAFAKAYDGKFFNLGCKSGSILTEVVNGKQVIKKIDGKYFMYWGEEHVFAATSEDLVNWTPYVNTDGSLRKLFSPRDGHFDSQLTECGPPAIYTPKGIVLLYNGKNSASRGDKRYTANVYAAGQALFDANDPTRFITRLDEPFFRPMDSFEKSGQYVDGTVFIEGMVYYKDKWYLY